MKRRLKALLKSHPRLAGALIWLYNHIPFNNKIRHKRKNRLEVHGLMKGCRIRFSGKNNLIRIEDGCVLKNCSIRISGSDNEVIFRRRSYGKYVDLCTENNGNVIDVGEGTSFSGRIHLACIEGTQIAIGRDCLFSSDIVIRTGDSHPIFNMQGERINQSRDVTIADHVWVGHRALINKGVFINRDNVVGTGAILTKTYDVVNSVIAGVPAKVVKTGVTWSAER